MYGFVKGQEGKHEDSLEKITELEKKYLIRFPKVLKDYYYKYDKESINLSVFEIDGYECEVAKMVPVIAEKMDFETITDYDKADGIIPDNLYPIARDRGGNYYYWDAETENVFLLFIDDIDNPFKVADSIEDFFIKIGEKE